MAWNKRYQKKAGKKSGLNTTQLTALWNTKREGLAVGTMKELDKLIVLVKQAKAANKGLTFFLWENTNDNYPGNYNLTANVERDMPNKIKETPMEEEEPEEEDLEGI